MEGFAQANRLWTHQWRWGCRLWSLADRVGILTPLLTNWVTSNIMHFLRDSRSPVKWAYQSWYTTVVLREVNDAVSGKDSTEFCNYDRSRVLPILPGPSPHLGCISEDSYTTSPLLNALLHSDYIASYSREPNHPFKALFRKAILTPTWDARNTLMPVQPQQ